MSLVVVKIKTPSQNAAQLHTSELADARGVLPGGVGILVSRWGCVNIASHITGGELGRKVCNGN